MMRRLTMLCRSAGFPRLLSKTQRSEGLHTSHATAQEEAHTVNQRYRPDASLSLGRFAIPLHTDLRTCTHSASKSSQRRPPNFTGAKAAEERKCHQIGCGRGGGRGETACAGTCAYRGTARHSQFHGTPHGTFFKKFHPVCPLWTPFHPL